MNRFDSDVWINFYLTIRHLNKARKFILVAQWIKVLIKNSCRSAFDSHRARTLFCFYDKISLPLCPHVSLKIFFSQKNCTRIIHSADFLFNLWKYFVSTLFSSHQNVFSSLTFEFHVHVRLSCSRGCAKIILGFRKFWLKMNLNEKFVPDCSWKCCWLLPIPMEMQILILFRFLKFKFISIKNVFHRNWKCLLLPMEMILNLPITWRNGKGDKGKFWKIVDILSSTCLRWN